MRILLVLLALCILGGVARADGIDTVAWVLQLPSWWGPGTVLGFILLSLLIDYALNFAVLGWPVMRWNGFERGRMARELVRYTLWGQVADRVGAFLSIFATAALDPWLDKSREGYFVEPLFVSKVVLSALAVGILVWYFARKRWGLSRGRALALSVAGGVLTNPGWGMLASVWLLKPRP